MIKYFLSLGFIFSSFFSFSQDYATVNPDREVLYTNLDWVGETNCNANSYFGIAIDSTKIIGANTVHYHFNTLRKTPETTDCNQFKKLPNWTGSATIIKTNGENIFLTNSGDSIRIRTRAIVNDKWHFYDYSNGDYFEAELSFKVFGSILSLTDSIKIITLTLKDNQGNTLSHDFNGREMVLSKNYGMWQTFDFSRFPADFSAFHIAGMSDPNSGIQNITAREIFDYNVGDEFHIDDASTSIPNYSRFTKERRIILSKTISTNQDTLTYRIERVSITHNYNWQAQTHDSSAVKDTIIGKIIISQWQRLNMVPSKLYTDIYGNPDGYCLNNSSYNNRLRKIQSLSAYFNIDPCFEYIIDYSIDGYYLEGLGYYYNSDDSPNQYHRNLLYYKKGSETWGTPINFNLLLSIQSNNNSQIISSVSPNPFNDFTILKIKNENKQQYQLMLMDVYGKAIQEYSFNDDQLIIRNNGTLKGLYIYKLLNNQNEVGTGKLIIY